MNPQETQQVVARDEKWVPSTEKVKISSTNIRLETTVPQKEETFQVIIDIIKNSTCFKAFTSTDVLEIFMQQIWYTIKKVQDTNSYEFLLANKKCTVNAEVFRTILEICPRVEGVDLTDVPDDETALTFLIDLGYKTASNDKLSSKGKKTAEESQETVDVFEKSKPEPESAKKKTSCKRRVKKKVTLSANDNIISDDPDAALELANFISQTKAEEAEAARKVHATHARIMTESVPKSEQEAVDIMQALKESKKTSRRQPDTRGSNEGTGSKPGVPDESTVISATSSEETGAKLGVPNKEKDITKEKVILKWGYEQYSEVSYDDNDDVEKDDKYGDGDADDEGDDHVSDTQDADKEDDETESDEDDIYKYKIHVHKDGDVEMKDAEGEESDKGEEKVTDAAKEEAERLQKKRMMPKRPKSLHQAQAYLTVKDFADADVSSLLDIPIQYETPQTQTPSVQTILVSLIPETTNLPPIPEIVTETPVSTTDPSPQVTPIISTVQQTTTPIPAPTITTDAPTITTVVPVSNALSAIELRVAKLEKDVSELKNVDHSFEALAVLLSQVLTVVDSYLDTKVEDLTKKPTPTAKQEFEKSPLEILKIKKEQAEKQKKLQFTIKSTDKADLE
ncbi:hypothetical protein Tco_0486373 [Tanacetum coccineum]